MIINVFMDVIPNGRLLSETLEDLGLTHANSVTYCHILFSGQVKMFLVSLRSLNCALTEERMSPACCLGDQSKVPSNFLWNLRWKRGPWNVFQL